MAWPMASPAGKYWRAKVWLMTMTGAAVVSAATARVDSEAIVTAVATAAIVVRAVRAMTPKHRLRSKNHG